ncbi:MAG: tetratricopeptide repeat protein [Bacteroidales bacterium]|nr:tetratricopeptide repeat protein [Bacteroidales bacterium]
MNSEINNIFNQSSCLTSREIEQYISGSLSKEEIRRVELHLADCPMCSDEIDGYILLSDKNKLPVVVKNINNKIDKKVSAAKVIPLHSSHKKSIAKRIISIAASLILLLGAGYIINFYMNSDDENLAETSSVEKTVLKENSLVTKNKNIKETDSDNIILEEKINNDVKTINGLEKPEKPGNKKVTEQKTIKIQENNFNKKNTVSENKNNKKEIASVDDIKSSDEISEDITISSLAPVENNINVNKTVGEENKKTAQNFSFKTTRGARFNSKTVNTKEIEKYKSMRESALLSYSMKIYDEALKDFNYYLKYKPADYEILYKTGFSYYKLRNYDKAISDFDKVIFEGVNKYVEDARWYKAKSLINLGKKENAKIILNEIIAENGKYQNKALDLLNTLN